MMDEVSVNTTLDALLVLVLPPDAVLDGWIAGYSALHGGHVTQNDTRVHRRLNDLSSHCKPKEKGNSFSKFQRKLSTIHSFPVQIHQPARHYTALDALNFNSFKFNPIRRGIRPEMAKVPQTTNRWR
jgi:hypothetical protein